MYDWKRFWYPKGGTCRLDFAGYLDDPESSYAYITNPEVVPFEAIAGTPCLVFLGEPGIGKSTVIDQAFEQSIRQGKPALKFELRGYDSSAELCNEIFGHPKFQAWLNGAHQLDLFLDSLDEGLLSLNVLSDTLSRKFSNYPCERLQLGSKSLLHKASKLGKIGWLILQSKHDSRARTSLTRTYPSYCKNPL